jgi:methyltransferase (TIGR00027 family)
LFAQKPIMKHDCPSDTSLLVARSILLASKDVQLRPLVAPGEAEMLAQIRAAAWFKFVLKNGWAHQMVFWLEQLMVAGVIAHYLARKRWIEVKVRESLAEGTRQVIILGAGLDTLAARLATEFQQVLFFELDHPATQSVKRQMPDPAPNLHWIPVDFATESIATVIQNYPQFLKNQPCTIVAEGLTMYLNPDRVSILLRNSAALAGPRGRVIFTFMDQAEDGSICFRGENPLVTWWLKSRREPFLWGISQAALPAWLIQNGLLGEIIANDADLRREILTPRGLGNIRLARGECLCSCSPTIP